MMPRLFAVAALFGTAHAGPCTIVAAAGGAAVVTVADIVYDENSSPAGCAVNMQDYTGMEPMVVEANCASLDDLSCMNMWPTTAGGPPLCLYQEGEDACSYTSNLARFLAGADGLF